MTGPTSHLLSPESPGSHILGLPQGLEDATSEILARETISLHDPATTWPSRSFERRRAFQHLLNRRVNFRQIPMILPNETDILFRYNRQILYGCINPRCETPTCLSRQKRVAKGPFRPYTVLSARSLATFLASQDHPEKGLCPHQPADIDPGQWSPATEVKKARKKTGNKESSFAGSRSSHAISPLQSANSVGVPPIHGRKIKVHIANGHTTTLGLKPETSRAGSYEGSKIHDHIRKDKDPKSFTQCLFDAVSMRLLHRANASDSHPPWAPSNERAQLAGPSSLDSSSLNFNAEGGDIVKQANKSAERPLVPNTEPARAAHGHNLPQIQPVPEVESIVSHNTSLEVVSTHDMVPESTHPEKDLETSETLDNDENAVVNIEDKESSLGAAIPPTVPQLNPQSEELDKSAPTTLRKTSVPVGRLGEPKSYPPVQSLSHFTNANILALKAARAVCRNDLYEQHCLLKFLGRTDLPQHSSRCGSYGDFLAYSGQSMTYILSHVEALLQSFLHVDDSNANSRVVWSYDFASIVDLFRKLRRIDMHPHKIFPNLWISAGKLYPSSVALNKRRSTRASDITSSSLDSLSNSQSCSLNDLEACHVIKIILAALVASVPKCSRMGWLAVRKLHASGQVAPFIDSENSPAEKKMIGKLVRTLHAFENDMALSLVKRLARSVDTMYHLAQARALAENAEKSRLQFTPIFSRVIDYVNADKFKIYVADNQGLPSVKNGEWVDPEIEPITWHSREWPIIIEWLRAVLLKEWDGKPKVAKGSTVGGALGLMLYIRK